LGLDDLAPSIGVQSSLCHCALNFFAQLFSFQTPERGARTIVYAAIEPAIEGSGGTYLSNCRIVGTNKLVDDAKECEKFFQFTCGLLKVDRFGPA
jgi:hypothetical protein